jgi:hypothetical protein
MSLDKDFDVGMVLERLTEMPSKILLHHEAQDLPHIILHDLSHDDIFGLDKAVYLIDNPDFDCLKGVAGYSRDECKFHKNDIWQDPYCFHSDMQHADFSSKLKQFLRNGLKRNDINTHNDSDLVELGESLGLKNPGFLTWQMRHGNHGILIFETNEQFLEKKQNLLKHAAPLLSLC